MVVVAIVVAVMIVVAIVPIVFGAPAVSMFIPPAVVSIPTTLTGFTQLIPRPLSLPASDAVVLNGFVEPVIGTGNTALAVVFIGMEKGSGGKH